jgi:hypothetical protein
MRTILSSVIVAVTVVFALTAGVSAQGWAATDFIIADQGGDQIAVFDQNLTFKNYLPVPAGGVINEPWGLTFLFNGNLLVAARNPGRLVVFTNSGSVVLDVVNANVGNPVDVKAAGTRVFTPRDSGTSGDAIAEFNSSGTHIGNFGTGNFYSMAVVPGNRLWAGNNQTALPGPPPPTISVFDLTTNTLTGTIPLDNGQVRTDTMFYSLPTSTVLMTGGSGFNVVYERSIAGTFVRQFTLPAGEFVNFGVTRGPSGKVYATQMFGGGRIQQWTSTGTYISTTDISANTVNPANILWAGSFAPTAAGVTVSGRVTDENGGGIYKATVSLADGSGNNRSVKTNPLGYFTMEDVPAGQGYILSAVHKSYQFEPQFVRVNDNVTDLIIVPSAGTNAAGIKTAKRP